jgi:hypothetical protein
MKKKPDPTILKISFLSNEIVKRTPKSHETIPLTTLYFKANPFPLLNFAQYLVFLKRKENPCKITIETFKSRNQIDFFVSS